MATMEIVGAAEAAQILDIGNTNFSHLRKQREGQENAFPDPDWQLKCGPIWKKSVVERWAKGFKASREAASTNGTKPAAKKAVAKKAPAKKATAAKAPAKKAPSKKKAAAKKAPAKKKLSLVK